MRKIYQVNKFRIFHSVVAFFLLGFLHANAQSTWNGSVSSDWNTPSNWTPAGIPVKTTDVIVTPGITFGISIKKGVECRSITINTGATLDFTTAATTTGYIGVYGNFVNNGTITNTSTAGFNIYFLGSTAQSISSSGDMASSKLAVYFGTKVTLLTDVKVDQVVIEDVTDPNLLLREYTIVSNVQPNVYLGSNKLTVGTYFYQYGNFHQQTGTLELNNGADSPYLTPATFFAETGSTWYNNTDPASTVIFVTGGLTYNNLRLSLTGVTYAEIGLPNEVDNNTNGAITCTGNMAVDGTGPAGLAFDLTVNGSLNIGSDIVFNPNGMVNTTYSNLVLKGDLINDGTFNGVNGPSPTGGGTVTLSGTNTQNISGAGSEIYFALVVNNTSTGGIVLNHDFQVSRTMTMQAGNVNLNGKNINFRGNGTLVGESETSRILGTIGTIFTTARTGAQSTGNIAGFGATITSPLTTSIIVTRGVAIQNVNGKPGITRYFDIASTPDAALNASFRFAYFDKEKNSLDESKFTMFRSSDGGATWNQADCNQTTTVRDTTTNTVTQTAIQTFATRWTLCQLLPSIAGTASADQSICKGVTAKLMVSNYAGSTFQWQDSSTTTWTNIPSSNSNTIFVSPTVTTKYRAIVSTTTCSDTTNTVKVTVLPDAIAGTAGSDKTFCSGQSTTVTLTGNTGTIQWQDSTVSGTWTNIASATAATFNTPALNVTTYYRAKVTVGTCSNYSNIVTITINPSVVAGTVSANDSICNNSIASLSVTGSTGTIQWQDSTASGVWTNIAGATAAAFTTPALTQTTYYRVIVSNANSTCFDKSSVITIKVIPLVVTGTAGSDTTICSGNGIKLKLTGSNGVIQWQDSTVSGVWASIGGATAATYNTPALNTTTYFRALVSISFCNKISNIVTAMVNPAAIAGVTTPDTLLCINSSVNLQLTGSSGNVQWQDSSKTSAGLWNNIASATSTSYTTPALTDTVYYRALLSNGTSTCFDTSRVIAVKIIPSILAGVAANDSSICSGNAAALRLTGSRGNIQWQDSSMISGVWKDIAGAKNATYKTAALNDTTYYRARLFAGGGCADTSNIVKIAVFPTPVAGTAGNDTAICTGNAVTLNLTGTTGTIQWQNTTVSTGPWTDIPGETNPALTTGILTDTTYYRAVVKNMASFSCYDTSNAVKVTVNPNPVAGTAGNDTTICSNTLAKLKLTGSFGSIQWQDSSVVTSGVWQNIATANSVNYTTAPLMDTTYFRAVLTTQGCTDDTSNIVVVNVKPNAIAGILSNDTIICTGGTATIKLTGTVGTIQWQASPDQVIFADSTGETSATLLAGPQSPVRYYKAVVTNNGCIVNSDTVKVNVSPISLRGTVSNDTILCKGGSDLLILTGSRGSIQWQSSDDNIAFTDTVGQTNDSLLVIPNTTKYFRAIVKSGVCSSVISDTIKVTVFPKTAKGIITPSTAVCKGSSTTIKLTGYSGSIQWQTSNDSIAFADTLGATLDSIVVSPANKRFYRAFLRSGVCTSDSSNIVTITTDNPPIAGTATADQTICKNTAVKIFVTGVTGSIQWQVSDDNIIFADSTGAVLDSISATPQSTRYYRALSKNGVCTPAPSNTVKITVNQTSFAGTISASDTICLYDAVSIKLKNGNGIKQWQVSDDGIAFTDSVNANTDTIKVAPLRTRYYRAYTKNGLCSTDTSAIAKITVSPPNYRGVASASDVCTGSSTNLKLTGYTGNIQWQKSADSLAWSNIASATTTPFAVSPTTVTYYRAVLTNNGVCPSDTSNAIKVKVVAAAVADSVIADNAETCVGNSTRIRLVGNTGTVQWQDSSKTTTGVWKNISGAMATSYYTPSLTDTVYYRAVVTNGICYDTSKTVRVAVRPAVQSTTISGQDSICVGSNAILNLNNLNSVRDSVAKWLQSNDNFSYTDVPLSTNLASITLSPTVTTFYKTVVTNGVCNDTTAAFKVVVSPLSVAGSAIGSGTHCTGTVTTLSINGYVGKLQWQSSTNGATYTNIANATLSTVDVSPLVTTFYRVSVKSGKCSIAFTNVIKLTVVQGSVAGAATVAKSTVCIGNPANITLTGSIGTIQWQQSNTATGPFTNILLNSTQSKYNGAVNAPTYFRALVKNAACDSVLSNVIFINTVPGVKAGIVKAFKDTICVGDSVKLNMSFSKGPIQWQVSSNGTNWQDINAAVDSSYISGPSSSTVYYRAVLNNNSCSDTTAQYKIIVNTPPVVGSITSTQSLCMGENAVITLNSYSGNVQWQASRDTNYINLKNEVQATVVITPYITTFYRVKVTRPGCKSIAYTNSDTVKVFPLSVSGVVNIDRTVRPGVSALISIKSYVGSIQWQSSLDSLTFTDIPGETGAILETNPKQNTYYRAIVSSASCTSISNTVKVTVDFAVYSISPNPAKDNITVSFNLPENQVIRIRIYDMLGKLLMENTFYGTQGYNELLLDISNYASGVNYLQIENKSTLIRGKFVKQ